MYPQDNNEFSNEDNECRFLYHRLRRICAEADAESALRYEVKQRLEAAIAVADAFAHRKQWSAPVDYLSPRDYTHADKDENVLRGAAKVLFKKLKDGNPNLRVYLDLVRTPNSLVPTLAIMLDWSHAEETLLDEKLSDQHHSDEQDNDNCWGR